MFAKCSDIYDSNSSLEPINSSIYDIHPKNNKNIVLPLVEILLDTTMPEINSYNTDYTDQSNIVFNWKLHWTTHYLSPVFVYWKLMCVNGEGGGGRHFLVMTCLRNTESLCYIKVRNSCM